MVTTLAFLAGVMIVVGWLVSLWIWPYTRCRWCSGSGNNTGSNQRRWGNCRRCGGSGARRRFGAKREE